MVPWWDPESHQARTGRAAQRVVQAVKHAHRSFRGWVEYNEYCFLKGWVKLGQVIPVQIYVHVQRQFCVVARTWILKPEDVLPVTSV